MKKIYKLTLLLLVICVSFSFSIDFQKENNFKTIIQKYDTTFKKFEGKKGHGWKQWARWKNFWEPRLFNADYPPDGKMLLNSLEASKSKISKNRLLGQNSDWQLIGPTVVPDNKLSYPAWGVGRINVVRQHPLLPNVLFIGSATGGLWKSIDKGKNWTNIPITNILSMGISDIAISESNPEIIYLATGDRDGYIQFGSYSVGILKSTDGGNTFSIIGLESGLNQSVVISRILVHPSNPDIVIAATSDGIYKSDNGGASWDIKVSGGLYRDLEFMPGNASVIYATAYGNSQYSGGIILKSINTGDTWTVVKNITNASRIELGVTQANSSKVYALCSSQFNTFGGLYLSSDKGASWTVQSTTPNILGIDVNGESQDGQGFYDLAIAVSPIYEDDVYIGGIHIWKSSDGGKQWKVLNNWVGGYGLPYLHADEHDLIIDPNNLDIYSANDGGLAVTHDDGVHWIDLSDGLSITQFYRFSNEQNLNNTIIAGAQDNGTFLYKNGTWSNVLGGDGMQALVDNSSEQYFYASSQYGDINRSDNGGANFTGIISPSLIAGESADWTTPFVLNPQKQSTIYVGYRNLYKSTNRGNNWTKISNFSGNPPLTFIAVAPSDSNVIYVVLRNSIYATYDGGSNWSKITAQGEFITSIAVDGTDSKHFWYTLSGYTDGQKVFDVTNFKIKNISFNFPNAPANTVVKQNETSRTLFVGTDIGVFKLDDFNDTWIPYNDGMPNLIISELEFNYGTGKLRAATWGRGVWESEVYNCQTAKPVFAVLGDSTFCEGDSVKLQIQGNYKRIVWSTGDTGKVVTIKQGGTYWATISDFNDCTAISDKINISVNSIPKIKINAQNNGFICDQDSILLSVGIGYSKYHWNTGDSTGKIYVKHPGTYSVQALTLFGCLTNPDTILVHQGEIPEKPDIFRKNDTLYATPGFAKYEWFWDGTLVKTTTKGFSQITKIGTYLVRVTNESGCQNFSDSLIVLSSVAETKMNAGFPILESTTDPDKFLLLSGSDNQFGNQSFKFVLFDNMGRVLNNQLIPAGDFIGGYTIELSGFTTGVYFIALSSREGTTLYKLMKTE